MNQEQASLIKISDSFKKIIVVNSNTPVWRNEQGILVMNMYDFLLNEESLDCEFCMKVTLNAIGAF